MSMPSQQMIFSVFALLCAVIGSGFDIKQRRIPNVLTGLSIVIALFLHGVLGGWGQLVSSVLAGLAGGGIFLVFYLAGGMGAGDVKLMTAVGCLLGPSPLRMVLIATAIAGAGFALALAIRRGRLRQTLTNVAAIAAHHGKEGFTQHPEFNLSNERTLRLPFAVPIAVGCVFGILGVVFGVSG